jgi:succinate dehydrogenase / fumarate reductase cytochrome b subunit
MKSGLPHLLLEVNRRQMSTTAPSKRQVATNSFPSRQGLAAWVSPFLQSSVGSKYIVAVTGLIATLFVIGHMLGNLQIFLGQDRINTYAASLKGLGGLLWFIRIILLTAFLLHIVLALRLNWRARQARPIGYACEKTVQASFASRHMVVSGLVILAFTIFHIAHYTLGIVKGAEVETQVVTPNRQMESVTTYSNYLDLRDDKGRQDVYSMMIYGFQDPIIAILYLVAQVLLFLHLTHGVASMFQTVGLNNPRAQRAIRMLAWTVALVVCVGNVAIIAGVWLGVMRPNVPVVRAVAGLLGVPGEIS